VVHFYSALDTSLGPLAVQSFADRLSAGRMILIGGADPLVKAGDDRLDFSKRTSEVIG
jgi:hypothetical protein